MLYITVRFDRLGEMIDGTPAEWNARDDVKTSENMQETSVFERVRSKNTERLITDVRRSKTIDEIENPSMFEKKCLTHKSAIQPKRDDLENENLFSETGEKITKCLIENRF